MLKTKTDRTMLPLKCVVCSSKKSRFMKEQEANRLSSLGIKLLLNVVALMSKKVVMTMIVAMTFYFC